MQAIVITTPGDASVLQLREVPTPVPSRGEVRIRVRATAINRADLLQRMGMYPAPKDAPQDVPGLEYAGEIDALGEGVDDLAIGDRVFGLVGGGAYAQALVTHARTVVKMPREMSFTDAAAIPEAFVTAYDALVIQCSLGIGETALVHAVGSGVGTAAVQIIRTIGARSIGTARGKEKLDRARPLGMDEGVVAKDGSFADAVLQSSAGRGVDVVLELVGGNYVSDDLACMANNARLVLVGLMAGLRTEVDLAAILRKRLIVRGTVLRARPLEEKIGAAHALARMVPSFERGAMRPVIDRVMPLANAAEAHVRMASNEGFGKIVLSVD